MKKGIQKVQKVQQVAFDHPVDHPKVPPVLRFMVGNLTGPRMRQDKQQEVHKEF